MCCDETIVRHRRHPGIGDRHARGPDPRRLAKRTTLLTRRTSLITDPPDGRLPLLTPEAQKRQAERVALERRRGPFDSWDDRPLQERCLMSQMAGPPMLPTIGKDATLGQTYH